MRIITMNNWNVGDYAIARIAKKTYAKVQITKSEDGTFWGDKVIGIERIGDESHVVEKLCYFVQLSRTGDRLWIPANELQLAERARPFYGQDKQVASVSTPSPTKKKKIKEDVTVSLIVDKVIDVVNPDINTVYEHKHNPATHRRNAGGAFRRFVNRHLNVVHMLSQPMADSNNNLCNGYDDLPVTLKYLMRNLTIRKEHCVSGGDSSDHENNYTTYLYDCWQFKHQMNRLARQVSESQEDRPSTSSESESADISTYLEEDHSGPALPWCLVCAESEELEKCARCPASYHRHCTKQWFTNMMHRKNLPRSIYDRMFALKKQLSSTRSIKVVEADMAASDLCPSCRWGPSVGYGDIVWQKMKTCPWWPARILSPGSLPSCLVSNRKQSNEWPVLYYGTENYSWCSHNSVVLFLPKHADNLLCEDEDASSRRAAIMDACDDYVSVYLV